MNIAGEHAKQREELISYKAGTSLERNLKRKRTVGLIVSGLLEFYSK